MKNIINDPWHFPRTALAKQILGMFDSGLASSLTFFAPRRMGKTEFLRKDIRPLAEQLGWRVFYFSFLDAGLHSEGQFIAALDQFSQHTSLISKAGSWFKNIGTVSGKIAEMKAEINLAQGEVHSSILASIQKLAEQGKPVLLLLDEIQALAGSKHKATIASLRTALDMHKESIKVIFTGSSREGLRQMFSVSSAPFFHYGQNLPFPDLGKAFTDHLADIFFQTTQRHLDKDILWNAFVDMQRSPQLARSLVERLALYPALNIESAKTQLIADTMGHRDFRGRWNDFKPLEQFILKAISSAQVELYSSQFRQQLAEAIGVENISVSNVQSALRSLSKKQLIFKPENGTYEIEDALFKEWIMDEA
ncbi:MAG: hypothetical protein Q4F77_06575 [Acinetobacter sp.]|uniref:ATP-binding protein n=1 Tax=Acinetobacter sp. TaxID=472 RepID=UPI0026E0D583|nr:ATP-binding protein [Acinetobacter sp.]MDO5542959.1 hypothetical protein [Acinetobacter sp.]